MPTILIADDHEIVRHAVRMIIESFPEDFDFLEASTCADAFAILSGQKVEFAILDMALSDGNIFALDHQITNYCTETKILVYSMNAEHVYAGRLLQKGVRGFISKQASVNELKNAISDLLKGEIYLSPAFKESLWKTSQVSNPIDSLSDRELQVAEYVILGLGSKEIAWKMNIDITTVSTYRRRAFEKLKVQNVFQLKEKFQLYRMHS